MLTDDAVQQALASEWIAAERESPTIRLLLPHLLLLQRERTLDALARCVRTPMGAETRRAGTLMDRLRTWREDRSGVALLEIWERAVIEVETTRWMPRLIGCRSNLPLAPAYARLHQHQHQHGAAAAMLLLLIAGETGFRSIIMHWESAATRMHVTNDALRVATILLLAEGWIDRERHDEESAEDGRVLSLRADRAALVLNGLTLQRDV